MSGLGICDKFDYNRQISRSKCTIEGHSHRAHSLKTLSNLLTSVDSFLEISGKYNHLEDWAENVAKILSLKGYIQNIVDVENTNKSSYINSEEYIYIGPLFIDSSEDVNYEYKSILANIFAIAYDSLKEEEMFENPPNIKLAIRCCLKRIKVMLGISNLVFQDRSADEILKRYDNKSVQWELEDIKKTCESFRHIIIISDNCFQGNEWDYLKPYFQEMYKYFADRYYDTIDQFNSMNK